MQRRSEEEEMGGGREGTPRTENQSQRWREEVCLLARVHEYEPTCVHQVAGVCSLHV